MAEVPQDNDNCSWNQLAFTPSNSVFVGDPIKPFDLLTLAQRCVPTAFGWYRLNAGPSTMIVRCVFPGIGWNVLIGPSERMTSEAMKDSAWYGIFFDDDLSKQNEGIR